MKSVLITGGSRGIGESMVRLFCERGYRVAFTYKNSDKEASALENDTGALAIKADSEIPEDISRAIKCAEKRNGEIDILINNASVSSISLITDVSLEEWNRVMNTAVTAAFLYTKGVLPQMIKKKQGRIINITSMWGIVGASCEVHYSAAKAGVIGLTKALAKEVGLSGIRVNCICPGVVMTDMMKDFDEQTIAELKEETPLNMLGTPKDIADTAVFLCSDKAKFITGQILGVNGGFVI